MDIEENVPLSGLTTFRTGGPVRFLLSLNSPAEATEAIAFGNEKGLPLIPFGRGSNMLAPDKGLQAAFARLLSDTISVAEDGEHSIYTAEAGASWDTLVLRAVTNGAWGIENLSSIPGTCGAAVVQNIGAYGAALSDTLLKVSAVDLKSGREVEFTNEGCAFGYRTSVFKKNTDRYLITNVSLRLSKSPQPNISYRDLAKSFSKTPNPPLQGIRDAVIEIRKGKFPPLDEFGTAGSFFLNPIVGESDAGVIRGRFPSMPVFTLPEGGIKVPLAWLFDHELSIKGMRIGKAFVWEKQPLVIAAEGGASASDVRALAEKISQLLYERTEIRIIPEVRIFFPEK